MPDDKKTIAPINAAFDDVAKAMVSPATPFGNQNNMLPAVSGQRPASPKQLKLDLGIEVERVVGGIEMGVLENGIPYLTQRGGRLLGPIHEIGRANILNGRYAGIYVFKRY